MNNFDLESELLELINRKAEGEYWDFKERWQSQNADLLHDILCMANSPANRDCYIIIGIKDKSCEVVGVCNENRKNQQNVIDLLQQNPKWAGGYIPEVYVRTFFILGKEVDVLIIKQSNNTPFYLLDDYKGNGSAIFKGAIYTRKGDTNTPKTSTADLYDTEILWKRRFGLLCNPSQRAKFYIRDLENWERIDGEEDKFGLRRFFFFYSLDPDYTIHLKYDSDEEEIVNKIKPTDINDVRVGSLYYYLFAICNINYHNDFSNDKRVVLYYKEIPLFSSLIESVDEGRTKVIPPEFDTNAYYVKDSFRYLIFKFVFEYMCGSYAEEARTSILRVIPLYENESECNEFMRYIEDNGFLYYKLCAKKMSGEALKRFDNTKIEIYKYHDISVEAEHIAKVIRENTNVVMSFAHKENEDFEGITKRLRIGKMLVDWLAEWRKLY